MIVLLVCGLPFASTAQKRYADQFNAWNSITLAVQLTDKWWLVQETFLRRSNGFNDPLQFNSGLSLERRMTHLAPSIGYAYWLTHPYGEFLTLATAPEHRTWQQLNSKHSTGRVKWDHRTRLEQRFIERFHREGEAVVSDGFRHVGRFRHQMQQTMVLAREKRSFETSLILAQEAILRFGDPSFIGLLDQYRLSMALGCKPAGTWQVRCGYLYQHLIRADNVRIERNHTLTLALRIDLPRKPPPPPPPGS